MSKKVMAGERHWKAKKEVKMKMVKKIMITVIAAALVFSAPLSHARAVFAQEESGRRGRGERFEALMEEVGITESQKDELLEQRRKHREEMKELRDAMKDVREELREELEKEDYSKTEIDRTVARMKDIQGDMISGRVDQFLRMKEVLTPEQFSKMVEIGARNRKARKERKRGGRRGR